jgi:phenylalanyl-tRNA synthetase alpha chain
MAELLQQLILDTLDKSTTIDDTRKLTLPGSSKLASSQDDQLLIQGALNSLLSREVQHSWIWSSIGLLMEFAYR